MHFLPDYHDDIAQFLSTELERKVEFDSLGFKWEGFDPALNVFGLKLGEPDQQDLVIERAVLNFSIIQSLKSLQPKFDHILIEKTRLSFTQKHDGAWQFLGFNTSTTSNKSQQISDGQSGSFDVLEFFNGTTINIKELNASIYNDAGELRSFRLPTLNVNYKDEQLFASGQLLENKGDKTLLNFSLKGRGLLTTGKLKGTVFVEARSSEFFDELLSVYDWQKISIQNIQASTRAWVNFEGFAINSIYGDVQVREMNWRAGNDSLAPINDLAFAYLWQNEGVNKKLSIENFAFDWAGLECKPINAEVFLVETGLSLQADRVELSCINQLMLSLGILPETLAKRLRKSNPKGDLKNIYFQQFTQSALNDVQSESSQNEVPGNKSTSFQFEAMLADVSVDDYEGTPSAKNIDGYVFATNGSGFVSFLSEDFELGFPDLFLEPWPIKRAEGVVSWEVEADEVVVASQGLRLWRDQESLIYGDFILRLNDEQSEDYLHLALGMQDILFPDAVKFVPYYLVDNGLYDWLAESLVAGTVGSGIYYGYGSVESSSPANSFTSSIALRSNQGILMFDKAWPYLEELNADIVIQNGQVWIDSPQANIVNTTLKNIKAYLPEGTANKANFISVTADSLITKELISYWLTESPISEHTKDIANQLVINNQAEINIDLKIPVSQPADPSKHQELSYLVNTKITDGLITHSPSKLDFSKVNGIVKVSSETGVSAKSIKAKLFDKPVNLAIKTDYRINKTEGKAKKDQITKLFLNGDLSVNNIFNYFDTSKPEFVNGSLGYLAELTLSSNPKQYPLLSISSNLKGASCACPEPFDKQASEEQTLKLSLLLKSEQSYLNGSIQSKAAPKVNLEMMFEKGELSFAEFLIGDAKQNASESKGINIAANLETANLKDWIDFLEKTLNEPTQDNKAIKPAAVVTRSDEANKNVKNQPVKSLAEVQDASSDGASSINKIQLEINELNAFEHILRDTTLVIQPFKNSWKIGVDGQDAIGQVLLADDDDNLNIQFQKLNVIPVEHENLESLTSNDSENILDPSGFPRLYFDVKTLQLDKRNVGSWQFDLVPDSTGSIFRNIKGSINGSIVEGQLNWRSEVGMQNTIATLSINGSDITSLFKAFDLPVLMTSSIYNADMALVWPSSPLDFSLAKLSGNLSLSLEDGFLKTEDQKTGALRLFGILNAESIKRRLKLDFSDLYKSGVGFDTFTTKASMDQGLLTLTDPLVIDGPAGKYILNGRSDLATKALDIDMLVELPFSQNVPLAALVLGAPQIGGLVWVADKLLGEPLSALTTSRYDITGTWDTPRVDLHQAMNASKKDRSNEKGTRNVGKP